jgi:alpha-tubulin suppressor-like RCC1 family protein
MSAMRAIVMLGVAVLAGCTELRTDFTCKGDASCTSASGQPGFCEPNNRCSVLDTSCANMHRYTDYAGPLSGQCTTALDCFVEIRAGADMTCVRSSTAVSCWGGGITTPTRLALPAELPASDVVQIALGGPGAARPGGIAPSVCLRSTTSDVYCAPTLRQPPTKMPALKASDIAIGSDHACAVTTDGQVVCWGANDSGQLGDGTTRPQMTPVPVTGGLVNVKQVATGADATCAITMDGAVWSWGSDDQDQLGRDISVFDDNDPSPGAINAARGNAPVQAMAVALGNQFACALQNGAVLCWGDNEHRELGDPMRMGSSSSTPAPVDLAAVQFSQLSTGGGHGCGVDTTHQLWCWGDNQVRQSAPSSLTSLPRPTLVDDDSGAALVANSVAVGSAHTCASSTGRGVLCWGSNVAGQIGSGTAGGTANPTVVPLSCP